MTDFSAFTKTYSFSGFINLVNAELGITAIVIVSVAFISLAGYLTSLYQSTSDPTRDLRITGKTFFEGLLILFFIPAFIWTLLYAGLQFIILILFLVVPFFMKLLGSRLAKGGFDFEDFLNMYYSLDKDGLARKLSSLITIPHATKLSKLNLLLIGIVVDFYLFTFFNPVFSLVNWLFILFYFIIYILDASVEAGFLFGVLWADYYEITKYGEDKISGFVLVRDKDHVIVMTENGIRLIYNSRIDEMVPSRPISLEEFKTKATRNSEEINQTTEPE